MPYSTTTILKQPKLIESGLRLIKILKELVNFPEMCQLEVFIQLNPQLKYREIFFKQKTKYKCSSL